MQTLEGHSEWVRSAQFSPDGTNIVSASGDETVRVWSAATGECVDIGGAQPRVSSAQFSPDGTNTYRRVGTRLCAWSAATGEVQTLEGTASG